MWWSTTLEPHSCRACARSAKAAAFSRSAAAAGRRSTIDNRYVFYRHTLDHRLDHEHDAGFPTRSWTSITAGNSTPVIDSTFALRDAAEAQRRLESGKHFGKITLDID